MLGNFHLVLALYCCLTSDKILSYIVLGVCLKPCVNCMLNASLVFFASFHFTCDS
jgi:hypothetical protein